MTGARNSTTEPQRVRRGYEHGASGAQLSPSGGHRGPSEGGQTWPQIAQLPRSVFTGWAVKFGLGAQLLSETHPLSTTPQSLNQSQKTLNNAHRRFPTHTGSGMQESTQTHKGAQVEQDRPTRGKYSFPQHSLLGRNVRPNQSYQIISSHACDLPPASPWIMQAVPSYTDTWAGLIRSCEVHAVNPYR